jgi:uncharacterized membrane protein YfcA
MPLSLTSTALVGLAVVVLVAGAINGVAVGKRLRERVGERLRRTVVLALLTVVGVRLVLGGLGGLSFSWL